MFNNQKKIANTTKDNIVISSVFILYIRKHHTLKKKMDNGEEPTTAMDGSNNATPNFNGAYGKMVLMPRLFYDWAIQSAKKVLPSLQQHNIAQNVTQAKQNANNPNAYRTYMIKANNYRHAENTTQDIDQRISNQLQQKSAPIMTINKELHSLKNHTKLMSTVLGMKRYNTLQVKKQTFIKALHHEESTKYDNFVNNPNDTLAPLPETMKNSTYHAATLKQFLSTNTGIISKDSDTGYTKVDGKVVSTHKNGVQRIIHYLNNDYEDRQQPKSPEGMNQFLYALSKRGFDFKNVGNSFLRKNVNRIIHEQRAKHQPQQQQVTPTQSVATPKTGYTPERHAKLMSKKRDIKKQLSQLKIGTVTTPKVGGYTPERHAKTEIKPKQTLKIKSSTFKSAKTHSGNIIKRKNTDDEDLFIHNKRKLFSGKENAAKGGTPLRRAVANEDADESPYKTLRKRTVNKKTIKRRLSRKKNE